MRCTDLNGDDRCPSKALRGRCYCSFHTPESEKGEGTLWQITEESKAILQSEDDDDEMLGMKMILAAKVAGTQPMSLARFLCVPDVRVQKIAKRFRDNLVWKGDKLCVEEDMNLDDAMEINIMLILYALVGAGKVVRVRGETHE